MDESKDRSTLPNLVRSHHRRKPATESVSLVRKSASPLALPLKDLEEDGSSVSSMRVDAASDIVEKPACQKDSSGESSNPEKWFEKSNKKIKASNPSFVDDEPPFFLRNSSSETTPPNLIQQREREQREDLNSSDPANESGFLAPETNASDEFRSVIDDLTVENKRLKKRIRKYEKSQKSALYPEALFELRVHGLPSEKKRELEKLLQEFVGGMGKSPFTQLTSTSGSAVPSSLLPEHQSSSHSRIGDSGYASMSLSGQNSSNMSRQDVEKGIEVSDAERKRDIQDYLLDIPTGLLPRRNGPMSEREKRKIVVRKIEQIFAGRDQASIGHQQSIQQQHVAQSAARADRRATEASGTLFPAEGTREARIMLNAEGSNDKKESSNTDSMTGSGQDSIDDESAYVEQRPTRPLDLDPFRAQVPAENMQYLRHLGFSPPDQSRMSPQPDGHGWIHLNILTNLAQTHFEHVTQDFVRKAIAESSKKLELSSDGRKVRWKGGKWTTSSSNTPDNDDNTRSTSSGKPSINSAFADKKPSSSSVSRHKLNYSPLFQQKEDSEMEDVGDDDLAFNQSHGAGPSSAFASSAKRMPALNEAKDDAPIIFYQNSHFYTDMSRDIGGSNRKSSGYSKIPADPIGASTLSARSDLYRKLQFEKGPLSRANPTIGMEYNVTNEKAFRGNIQEEELRVIARSGKTSSSSSHTPDPYEFEASGIGGVVPADNFAISVRSRQNADSRKLGDRSASGSRRSRNYAPKIRKLLRENRPASPSTASASSPFNRSRTGSQRPIVQREIIGSQRRELPASQLPDAVFLYGTSDEDEDDEDEEMDYESGSELSSESNVPKSAPQRMDWAPSLHFLSANTTPLSESVDATQRQRSSNQKQLRSSKESDHDEDEEEEEDEEDGEGGKTSDESMDLLEIARAVDPRGVRAKEREFESGVADRLAEDIPAGSSAATAEGGSGFNSPAIALGTTASIFQSSSSMPPPPRKKRSRKTDDGEVQGSRSHKSPKME